MHEQKNHENYNNSTKFQSSSCLNKCQILSGSIFVFMPNRFSSYLQIITVLLTSFMHIIAINFIIIIWPNRKTIRKKCLSLNIYKTFLLKFFKSYNLNRKKNVFTW